MDDTREVELLGGRTTTGVVRVGDTVRRPAGRHSAFVHRLLAQLEKAGFTGAPRALGIDASGREILTFVAGHVPPDLGVYSIEQLVAAAQLIRRFHDSSSNCDLTAGAEVVCHGDLSPCNTVFRDNVPYALIDFDAAGPGTRAFDVGHALWMWLDIGNDARPADVQAARAVAMLEGYGWRGRIDVADLIADSIRQTLTRTTGKPEIEDWMHACLAWVERHRADLPRHG